MAVLGGQNMKVKKLVPSNIPLGWSLPTCGIAMLNIRISQTSSCLLSPSIKRKGGMGRKELNSMFGTSCRLQWRYVQGNNSWVIAGIECVLVGKELPRELKRSRDGSGGLDGSQWSPFSFIKEWAFLHPHSDFLWLQQSDMYAFAIGTLFVLSHFYPIPLLPSIRMAAKRLPFPLLASQQALCCGTGREIMKCPRSPNALHTAEWRLALHLTSLEFWPN